MEVKDLDRQLRERNLGNLYFFYGEEQFLMENKIKSIKKALLSPDFADLNFVQLEGKRLSYQQISDELLSVPIMDEKKLIVIKNSGIFNNAKLTDYKSITEAIADIPDYLCVIFTEVEFDKKKEKNLEPIKRHGELVKFDLLSPIQLERWLDKLFSDKGKTVLPRELNRMVSLCGQNMAVLFNEYNKLLGFLGEREKLTSADIDAVVSKSTEARLFDVIDGIATGRRQGVFDELEALHSTGENPSTILSLLSSRLGELLMVKQLSYDKLSVDKISAYFEPKRPTFVVNKLIEQSKVFTEEYLTKMTLLGPEYTAMVRTGRMDKWAAIELYAAELLKNAQTAKK